MVAPVRQRLTPTLFDKLVADTDMAGMRNEAETPVVARERLAFYSVPKLERFNEAALRATVRRELAWLLNTTNFGATQELTAYPRVASSVLNYGLPDLAGKTHDRRAVMQRARELRAAIRAFEPRIDGKTLVVEPIEDASHPHQITFIIRGDITAAAQAMPVKFQTRIDIETASVDVDE